MTHIAHILKEGLLCEDTVVAAVVEEEESEKDGLLF